MDIEINDYEILDRANQFRDAADILKQSNELIPTGLNACLNSLRKAVLIQSCVHYQI